MRQDHVVDLAVIGKGIVGTLRDQRAPVVGHRLAERAAEQMPRTLCDDHLPPKRRLGGIGSRRSSPAARLDHEIWADRAGSRSPTRRSPCEFSSDIEPATGKRRSGQWDAQRRHLHHGSNHAASAGHQRLLEIRLRQDVGSAADHLHRFGHARDSISIGTAASAWGRDRRIARRWNLARSNAETSNGNVRM